LYFAGYPKTLHLDSCKLYQLPVGVFSNFHYIEELTLNGNKLSRWENGNDVFGNLTSIKHLDIGGNRINIINETSFPVPLLLSMKTLSRCGKNKNFELTNVLCDLDNQNFNISEDADVNVA
jgi:Leucine-rich repeat (LRR) protein